MQMQLRPTPKPAKRSNAACSPQGVGRLQRREIPSGPKWRGESMLSWRTRRTKMRDSSASKKILCLPLLAIRMPGLKSSRARVMTVPRTRPFIVSRRASMYLFVRSSPHVRVEYRRILARSARAISVRTSRFTGWQTGRRSRPRSRSQSPDRLPRPRSRGLGRP